MFFQPHVETLFYFFGQFPTIPPLFFVRYQILKNSWCIQNTKATGKTDTLLGEINRVKFCDTITPNLTLKFLMLYLTHGYGVDFLDRSNFVLAREMPTELFSFSRKLHLVARDHIRVSSPRHQRKTNQNIIRFQILLLSYSDSF